MNRLKLWVFAATLIGGLSVFTACSSGSDDVQEPVVKPDPDDNGANSSSDDIGYSTLNLTSPAVGQLIGSDGKNYTTLPSGVTAVAMIAYVGSDTYDATYKNGLAIALADEAKSNWSTAKSTCEGKTAITGAKWCLPSQDQWKQMFKANGGNEGSYTGLNTTITTARGTALPEYAGYWSSSESRPGVDAYFVFLNYVYADWMWGSEDSDNQVRACLAF